MRCERHPVINRHTSLSLSEDYALSGGEVLVETAGYISKTEQLNRLNAAGRRLVDHYKNLYPGDHVDHEYDPTAQIGFDYFDLHEYARVVRRHGIEDKPADIAAPAPPSPPSQEKSTSAPDVPSTPG